MDTNTFTKSLLGPDYATALERAANAADRNVHDMLGLLTAIVGYCLDHHTCAVDLTDLANIFGDKRLDLSPIGALADSGFLKCDVPTPVATSFYVPAADKLMMMMPDEADRQN